MYVTFSLFANYILPTILLLAYKKEEISVLTNINDYHRSRPTQDTQYPE